jgi:putative glutamine amidotransferase
MAGLIKRPVIGVSGPDKGGLVAWFFTWLAISISGGKAIRITPQKHLPLNQLDGLVLGGGADIAPTLYGGKLKENELLANKNETTFWQNFFDLLFSPFIFFVRKLFSIKRHYHPDIERDIMEKSLIKAAFNRQIPILGICRGAQLLNIYLGGSLHQDIQDFYEEIPQVTSVLPRKKICITPGSLLSKILQKETSWVNALHHQAIDKLGDTLHPVAKEENGIIQAVESKSYPFLVGVQWHPEYLPQHKSHRQIFRSLIQAATAQN